VSDKFITIPIVVGALIDPFDGIALGPAQTPTLGNVSFALGAAAFLVLALAMAYRAREAIAVFALAAVISSAVWAIASTLYYLDLPILPHLVAALEVLRTVSWVALLLSLPLRDAVLARIGRLPPVPVALAAGAAALAIASVPLWVSATTAANGLVVTPTLGLAGAVVGLLATETLYRSTVPGERWKIKFLCISAGLMFAYDLCLYADASLFKTIDPALQEARGAVQALCALLAGVAAARADIWRTSLTISRGVVMGATTLIASGLYLLLAAIAGFWLGKVGGERGDVIQIVFLAGAFAVLAATLFSGAYWAHVRNFVNRHFFRHKYDWREEWLRFMNTLARSQDASLGERCIKAVADIVDSPGGAMILMEEGPGPQTVSWNFGPPNLPRQAARSFGATLRETQPVMDLEQLRRGQESSAGVEVPVELLANERCWLIVPLWHRRLIGLVLLAPPRAPRGLDWEDYDLLGIVGRQVASYLAEQRAQEALEEAREFEIFNRRFAFVLHDVKNLVSQLSVLGSNLGKHGHRKEFRSDAVASLTDAATTMNRLMERIGAFRGQDTPSAALPLEPVIRRIVAGRQGEARLAVECDDAEVRVLGDADRLEALLSHLVANAIEAVGERGAVTVKLQRNGRFAVIDVIDNGPGMSREFIERELFKPFHSTKKRGMGIGAYQCREYAREIGGDLEAISELGKGTTMRVTLPVENRAQG
jgi:putative PEP-CTERM system histidine kinase